MSKVLRTTTEVMEALGGTPKVATLTRRKEKAPSNWHQFDHFPPDTFLVMNEELHRLGFRAPISLWRMVPPKSKIFATFSALKAQLGGAI